MAISSTAIGANTVQISLNGELDALNLLTQLDAAIVAGGWAQYDVYNNGTQRIYRSLCKDGVTYKYFGLYFDPIDFKMSTTCYESWDNVNHVGTNEVATYNRTGQMHFTLTGSDVIVMVSPRWLVLQTFIRNNPGPWAGVFECAREAAEDTPEAGYPPFFWTTSVLVSTALNYKYASFPRSRAGGTGTAAVADGWMTPYTRIGATTTTNGSKLVGYSTYAWDTAKKIVLSLRPTFGETEVHGKVFGLKAVSNVGAPFNRVSIPIDSDFHYSGLGTPTDHWVLSNTPMHDGNQIAKSGSNMASNASFGGFCTLPATGRYAVFTGTDFYITTSSGVCKVDGTTAQLPSSTTHLPGVGASDHHDVVFDGRYIYAANPTGITRIDTLNGDSVSTLALPAGASALYFDGTYLWAGARNSAANNSLYKINASTFTLNSTIIIPTAAGNGYLGGMCTDFNGNLYVMSAESKVYKVVISTNTVSTLISSFSAATGRACAVIFNGANLELYASTNGSSNFTMGVYTLSGSAVYGGSTTAAHTASSFSPGNRMPTLKVGVFNAGVMPTTNTPIYPNSSSGFGLPVNTNGTMIALTAGTYSSTSGAYANCDGARIWTIQNTTFMISTNICHPDAEGVSYNRFLLPK